MKRLLILLPVLLLSCKTVPAVIDTSETDSIAAETIVQGKDLESTIDDIKDITDTAKETGVITEKDTLIYSILLFRKPLNQHECRQAVFVQTFYGQAH